MTKGSNHLPRTAFAYLRFLAASGVRSCQRPSKRTLAQMVDLNLIRITRTSRLAGDHDYAITPGGRLVLAIFDESGRRAAS